MSIKLAWTSPEKSVVQSQVWQCNATEEAMAQPKDSVVSSPHRMVNVDASLPSVKVNRPTTSQLGHLSAPWGPKARQRELRAQRYYALLHKKLLALMESLRDPGRGGALEWALTLAPQVDCGSGA